MRLLTQLSMAFTLAFVLSNPALAVIISEMAENFRADAGRDRNIDIQIDGETVSLDDFVEDEEVLRRIEQAVSPSIQRHRVGG